MKTGARRSKDRKKANGVKNNKDSEMHTEVRRYKNKERAMQKEDPTSAFKKRLSMQGLYAHGCTSGKVERDFGLSKEAQARAEANLSRILELANNVSEDNQAKKTNNVSEDNQAKEVSVPASPPEQSTSMTSIREYLQNVNEVTANSKKDPKKVKSNSSKRDKNSEDLQKTIENRLTTAVRIGVGDKSKCLGSSTKRLNSTLKRVKAQTKKRCRDGTCGVTKKMYKLLEWRLEGGSERNCNDMQGMKVIRTPTSSEYLQVTRAIRSSDAPDTVALRTRSCGVVKKSPEIELIKEVQPLVIQPSSLNITCPGTTIISPRALLVRYEEKLEKNKIITSLPDGMSASVCNSVQEYVPKSEKRKGRRKTGRDVELESSRDEIAIKNKNTKDISLKKMHESNVQTTKERGKQVLDMSYQPKCPKTVVINPLDYLERYEKQTDNQRRKLINSFDMNTVSETDIQECAGTSMIGCGSQTRQESAQYTSINMIDSDSIDNSRPKDLSIGERLSLKKRRRNELGESSRETMVLWQDRQPERSPDSVNKVWKNLVPEAVADGTHNHLSDNGQIISRIPPALHPEHGGSLQTDNVGCCYDSNNVVSNRERFSPDTDLVSEQSKSRTHSCELDVLEEELSKDFVFPRYVQENLGNGRNVKNMEKSNKIMKLRHIKSRGNTNTYYCAVQSSSHSSSSSSNSQSSSQDYPGWLPVYHQDRQQCVSSDLTKQDLAAGIESSSSCFLQRELEQHPQKMKIMEPPSQDDQHRFYRRKLY